MAESAVQRPFWIPTKLRAVGAPTATLVLTVVLLVALLSMSALLVWQSYRDTIRSAESKAASSAQIVAAHTGWIGQAAFQALRRVDSALGPRPDVLMTGTIGDLDEAVATLPWGIYVWVFDADGDAILTNADPTEPVNIAKQEYFQTLRQQDDWHVSKMVDGPLGHGKVFTIGRRIERQGKFLGAAVMVIPASLLTEFWASLDLGSGSTIGLIREDGWLVARHPIPEEALDMSEHVLLTEHLPHSPSGSYQFASSPADGMARIVGYHSVPGLPLIAVAGISREAALAPFWSRLLAIALIVGPILAGLIATSGWVVALLRRDHRQREALARALEQNRLLLREVHHRVKNDLQTAISLIRVHPLPRETTDELVDRIAGMAAVHQQIYQADSFRVLCLTTYIRGLADNLRRSHGDTIEVDCHLAEIEIDAERAVPLGLIVNEVATNAFKHAFPNGQKGRITISLERTGPGRARLEIRDNGVGFDANSAPGMGRRLTEGLSHDIGGECEFRNDGGTVFSLSFPVRGA